MAYIAEHLSVEELGRRARTSGDACARAWRHRPPMAGSGTPSRSPLGWHRNSASSRSTRSAPGTRCRRSAGRSRRHVPETRLRPVLTSRKPSKKKLAALLAEEEARQPGRPVALFCTDEHRIGLKPVIRRVWVLRGQRPTALGHHRYEWLYVTAFVAPATGESHWYVGNGVSKPLFERLLAAFAREAGAGPHRTIILLLDGAGWHTEPGLAIPDGLRLIYLPPYTPELQPAEHLWHLVDEPIVNRHFDQLAEIQDCIEQRCRDLEAQPDALRDNTLFHWWPQPARPN